jgi:hypothetical protein
VKKMKMMMLAISLTSVVATSAYAANIYFEQGTGVSISYDSDNTQWRSDAVTIGSYGTKYARAYTEIWGAVKSEDTKKARKNQGQQLMLVHTAQLDWMTLMPHRIIEFGGLLVTLIQLLRRIEQNFS